MREVGYTNQAVSDNRLQISGCSGVLVARLNGVQEAVSSILATRTKRSNDFATEVVGPFLFLCLRQTAFLRATGETTAEIKHKNFVGCVEYHA